MRRLIVKLPFREKSVPNTGENVPDERTAATSTERSRKYRQKLKTDPALKQKCEKLVLEKRAENKAYQKKVKEQRKESKEYDEYIKLRDELRKRNQRKLKAQNKEKIKGTNT